MKRVIYKTLIIQNFLSVGNDQVGIDIQNGLNLITGRNMDNPERVNGIGKSTIPEAFFYALFGDTIRKTKKDFVVNNVTRGKGRVELEFDVETEGGITSYRIVRQVKPSKVELWKGDEDITGSTISNNKGFISELVGSNEAICRSCDILSLSDSTPFMSLKAEDKRNFINDIFSFGVFGKMGKDLKSLVSKNKTDMGISQSKLEEINTSLLTIQKQQEAYKKQLEEREKILNERKERVNLQIEETEKQISEIVIKDSSELENDKIKFEDAWNKIDGKIVTIKSSFSEKKTLLGLKKKEIEKYSKVEDGVECEHCFQQIEHSHIQNLEGKMDILNVQRNDLQLSMNLLLQDEESFLKKKGLIQKKVAQLQSDINEIKVSSQKVASLERSLKEYKENLAELLKDIAEPEAPIFENSLKETEERKTAESTNFTQLKQHSDDLEICKFILSEEGVKSFAVKRLIGMLNSSIQKYITELGMSMRCKFDEYFEETLMNERGVEVSYGNFSGGERKTIDLACKWAFKDIRAKISGVTSNLEFNDEIFDSAFDELGLDLLIETVKRRIDKYKLSVYAISHRKETLKHIDGEIVNLEKDGGITRRVSS